MCQENFTDWFLLQKRSWCDIRDIKEREHHFVYWLAGNYGNVLDILSLCKADFLRRSGGYGWKIQRSRWQNRQYDCHEYQRSSILDLKNKIRFICHIPVSPQTCSCQDKADILRHLSMHGRPELHMVFSRFPRRPSRTRLSCLPERVRGSQER